MKKKLCYASCCCSEKTFEYLWKDDMISAPAQSVQKYHRLFAEGFLANGFDVTMISFIAVPQEKIEEFEQGKRECINAISYNYLPYSKNKFVRYFKAVYNSYKLTRMNLRSGSEFSIGDILCSSVSLGCLLGTLREKKPFYAIVTDLPNMFVGYQRSLKYYIEEYIIKRASGYVVLTEQMNLAINKDGKPFVVLEGHVDGHERFETENLSKTSNKFIVMYAGNMAKQYGIDYLVKGFIDAEIDNSELHLYGNGDFAEQLAEISKMHKNIIYYGERFNSEIVYAEKRASLLVNPRPTNEEYTKYSFPSKNMEYMLSGTPLLTTALPGMPKEYYEHVFLVRKESSEGIAEMLTAISSMNKEELTAKGRKAREFVLREKSNSNQVRKFINTLL